MIKPGYVHSAGSNYSLNWLHLAMLHFLFCTVPGSFKLNKHVKEEVSFVFILKLTMSNFQL